MATLYKPPTVCYGDKRICNRCGASVNWGFTHFPDNPFYNGVCEITAAFSERGKHDELILSESRLDLCFDCLNEFRKWVSSENQK